MGKRHFIVTEEHIKLLRAAYVSWENCEFGAPAIDCKRPYGNGYVYGDIAEILQIHPEDEDGTFSDEQIERMERWHRETEKALQIFLRTGMMEPGTYVSDACEDNWTREGSR